VNGTSAEAVGVDEAVVDPPAPPLAREREAGEAERIEVAVHGAARASDLLGERVDVGPGAALRELLHELPLPGGLSRADHPRSRAAEPAAPARSRVSATR
jgi:hypothetical protein